MKFKFLKCKKRLEKHRNHWKQIRAVVINSTERKYHSQTVEERSTWAE